MILDINHDKVCGICGAPATSTARDAVETTKPGDTFRNFDAGIAVRFGCDKHPATSLTYTKDGAVEFSFPVILERTVPPFIEEESRKTDVSEAAEILGLSAVTVREHIRRGWIDAKPNENGRLMMSEAHLRLYARAMEETKTRRDWRRTVREHLRGTVVSAY